MKPLKIKFAKPIITDEDRESIVSVLMSDILTHGPNCKEFELQFAAMVGGVSAVTMSSCMAALHMGSISANFSSGDEVIVPAMTHVATVHAIELSGATPIFVDCELDTGNMDLDLLAEKITMKTRGISVVHFAGIPLDMIKLNNLIEGRDIFVIEDCALAVGAMIDNLHVGQFGDVGCFSFYPAKHMTSAEGGMLVSKHEHLAEKIRKFRAFSVDRDFNSRKIPGLYDVDNVGLNYRMSELQAALGLSQLQKVGQFAAKRKANFSALQQQLKGHPNITLLDSTQERIKNAYYAAVIQLNGDLKRYRNHIVMQLKEFGIETSIYYPRAIPEMTYYKNKYNLPDEDHCNANIIANESIALPVGPHLTPQDMNTILSTIDNIISDIV